MLFAGLQEVRIVENQRDSSLFQPENFTWAKVTLEDLS